MMNLKREAVCLFIVLSTVAVQTCGISNGDKSSTLCDQATISPTGVYRKNLQGREKRNPEEAPSQLSGIMAIDEQHTYERQATHQSKQLYRTREVGQQDEILPENCPSKSSAYKNIFKVKRSTNDNASDTIEAQRMQFKGTCNYVSCQSSEFRQGDIITGFKELIEFHSPDYPNPYPNNVKCFFRFEIPFGRRVNLTCPVLDLGAGDNFTINGLDLPINNNTGKVYPMKISRDFEMEFTSDAEGSSTGFICSMIALGPDSEQQESDGNNIPPWLRVQDDSNQV